MAGDGGMKALHIPITLSRIASIEDILWKARTSFDVKRRGIQYFPTRHSDR